MAFMVPTYHEDRPYEVETTWGTYIVPSWLVGKNPTLESIKDYVEGEPEEIKQLHKGVITRLSAPGYMDCTDWSFFDTYEEARDYVQEYYEVDPDTGDDLDGEENNENDRS